MTHVLLTGSSGFLGSRLAQVMNEKKVFSLSLASRQAPMSTKKQHFVVGDLSAHTDWTVALANQEVVIHAAARAHIMKDEVADPLAEYRKVNVEGTLTLARQAAEAGVKRFIFISSIKVNGEQTPLGKPFTAEDAPAPEDAYGVSKFEAEQGLWQVSKETGLQLVIIRPPLVYGSGVKGNFASMIKLMQKGFPLPLGAVHNQRSLVALDNLVDLIITCVTHPVAANQVFLVADGQDVSTTELLKGVANAAGKPARLVPVPAVMLQLAATAVGKKAVAQRLLGSLQVDISKARELLGWTPPLTLEQGLARCFYDPHV